MSEAAATTPVDRTARALYALLDLSKALGSELDLSALRTVIIEKASAVVGAQRTRFYSPDELTPLLRTDRLTNTGSTIAAPILDSTGGLLGVVESTNKTDGGHFDADDESLMSAIASHIAVAMERARLTSAFLEHERFSEALKLASDIQMRMLPAAAVSAGEDSPFDLHAFIRPAKMVGGDLYDFALHGQRLYFCVGDVSGKGIGSALVMALTKTLFRANLPYFEDAARLTEAVNVRLCEDTGPTIFVTAFCGFLDLSSGVLHFCNAGHDRPFILREDGSAELLQSKPGLALGVMPAFRYPLQEITLAPGEALFLYTDGVTEATSTSEELFSVDRLQEALEQNGRGTALRLIAGVTGSIEAFVGGAPQSDDLTMMCVRYRGDRR